MGRWQPHPNDTPMDINRYARWGMVVVALIALGGWWIHP